MTLSTLIRVDCWFNTANAQGVDIGLALRNFKRSSAIAEIRI